MKRKTHEEYVEELAIKNSNVEVLGQYVDAKTPIPHRCLMHHVIWNIAPSNALQGAGCEECRRDKIRQYHQKTHEQYVQELAIKNPNIKVVDKYIDALTPILHHCEIHNVFWKISPANALEGCGCAKCKSDKIVQALRKTHDEYVQELAKEKPYITVLDSYINAFTPIQHYCHKHNKIWTASPNVVLHGCGCPDCRLEKDWNGLPRTHERYIALVTKINPDIQVVGQYIDAITPIAHYCKKHQITWNTSPENILHGHGCYECGNEKASLKNTKTHEQYVQDVSMVNKYILVLEQYVDCETAILHQCTKCGTIWKPIPHNILSGRGCPGCNQSYGEQRVSNWLMSHNCQYTIQYTFADCKHKKVLPFDFYLPVHNICIEYDGEQHFMPVDFYGKGIEYAIQKFTEIQHRDKIKDTYCREHNIPLLRIPYYANVEEELEKFFYSF